MCPLFQGKVNVKFPTWGEVPKCVLQEELRRSRFLWYQDSEDEHILPFVCP